MFENLLEMEGERERATQELHFFAEGREENTDVEEREKERER